MIRVARPLLETWSVTRVGSTGPTTSSRPCTPHRASPTSSAFSSSSINGHPRQFSTTRFKSRDERFNAPFSYTTLPSRSLLSITGPDVDKFLQGLITNDILRLKTKPKEALYAGVLKADGRALHDLFIYSESNEASSDASYLLDHPTEVSDTFRKYLKRHILRSKVKLAPSASPTQVVNAAWCSLPYLDERNGMSDEAVAWLQSRASLDVRDAAMGWRWPASQEAEAPPSHLFQHVTPAHHHLHRLLLGIPEGQADLATLPLEGNLDLLNAIDFKKGCYVGQELTARTHHRGVVRKRQVPVRFFREGEDVPEELYSSTTRLQPYPELFPLPPPGSQLTPPSIVGTRSASRQSGRLHSSLPVITPMGSSFALGLATVRLDQITSNTKDGGVYVVKAELEDGAERGWGAGESDEEGGRWMCKGFVPGDGWLKRGLQEERVRKGEDASGEE